MYVTGFFNYRPLLGKINLQKKDPFDGAFYGSTKSNVSLFSLFQKTTPSHMTTTCIIFFSVEVANEMLLNCHMLRSPISGHK